MIRAHMLSLPSLLLLGLTAVNASASPPPDLRQAIRMGDLVRVQDLLARSGLVEDKSQRNTLLGEAISLYEYVAARATVRQKQSYQEIVRLLLERGADPNAVNRDGQTIFQWDTSISPEILRMLIAYGVDLAPKSPYNDTWTPLMRMLEAGSYQNVQLMAEAGVNLESKDAYGLTPLMRAANWTFHESLPCSSDERALEIFKILVSRGVALDTQTSNGDTALMLAARRHGELVKFLVEAGADITLRNRWGANALTFAARQGARDAGVQALIAHGAQVGPVEALLMHQEAKCLKMLEQGADSHGVGPYGETLLMIAAEQGNLPLVKRLLAMGLDINAKDRSGATALIVAVGGRSMPYYADLAFFQETVKQVDKRRELVAFLLAQGADIDAVMDDGRGRLYTALGVARLVNTDKIAPLLQAHGARMESFRKPPNPSAHLVGPTP